jgi:hypothetical protein
MICRTFIFVFLCYFSNHVLIQVQPDKYTSILKKGFNGKQMIDYSVEKFVFIIFFNIFRLLFGVNVHETKSHEAFNNEQITQSS